MNPANIFFGFLPSILWLNFYLKEDVKPEPKHLILKVFFFGILVAFFAMFFELFLFEIFSSLNLPSIFSQIFQFFFIVAFVEEFLKFLVVFFFIFGNPEFEEPVDGMIYMIVSALGFAATENTLLSIPYQTFREVIEISILRFFGATFLHALCSAIFGYFVAIYYFKTKKKIDIFLGLSFSAILHGIYNFSIILLIGFWQFFFIFSFLSFLAIVTFFLFKRLKK